MENRSDKLYSSQRKGSQEENKESGYKKQVNKCTANESYKSTAKNNLSKQIDSIFKEVREELENYKADIILQLANLKSLKIDKENLNNLNEYQNKLSALSSDDQNCDELNKIDIKLNKDKLSQLFKDCISIDLEVNKIEHTPRLVFYDKDVKMFKIHDILTNKNLFIPLPEMEEDITEFSYIDVNKLDKSNQLYIIGGEIRSLSGYLSYSNKAFVLDESSNTLIEKCSMKNGRYGHRLNCIFRKEDTLEVSSYIIATGTKYPEDKSSSVEIYNIAENKWDDGPDMNTPRFFHTSVVVDNCVLYVIGGCDAHNEKRTLDSIERLDFNDPIFTWEEIEFKNINNAWTPRDTCGSLSINNNEIVIFGGSHGWTCDSFIFNIENSEIVNSNKYLMKSEEFTFSHAVYATGNKVYIIGGLFKDIHIYYKEKWFILDKDLIEW